VKIERFESLNLTNSSWRVSSYSGGNNECVEVASMVNRSVPVRDSKRPGGPIIGFGRDAWAAFLDGMR
jgi:hypothetical protein